MDAAIVVEGFVLIPSCPQEQEEVHEIVFVYVEYLGALSSDPAHF